MMRRQEAKHHGAAARPWMAALAAALLGALAGCMEPTPDGPFLDESEAPDPGSPATDGPAPGAPLPPPPISSICPAGVRAGKMQVQNVCPAPQAGSSWQVKQLFGAGAPPSLARYCTYVWTGGGEPALNQLPSENERPGKEWTQPDCLAVTPMATSDTAEAIVRGSVRDAFWSAAERPGSLPAPGASGTLVRVALLDSWPSVTSLGSSRHGLGMAGIIDDLTCDVSAASPCPVDIVPYLALNVVEMGVVDNTEGGYYGRQTRLANLIYQAVDDWQTLAPGSKLVMNLSLGWDSEYHTLATGGARPSVQAVHDALEHAVCAGALVIAAAGNSPFGPSPSQGLVYPAAWENEVGGCSAAPPLVWAVGGLDDLDEPLYNVRTGGMPVLAAPGQLGYSVEELAIGTSPAGTFTGSSVGAAVATAAAAATWMYDASLTATDVMSTVAASAVALPSASTSCGAGCPPVRRVSVCRSAAAVAPTAVPCSTHGPGAGSMPAWTNLETHLLELLATKTFPGPPLSKSLVVPGCSPVPVHEPLSVFTFPGPSGCPMEEFENAILAPAVGPQPGSDPCGVCALSVIPGGDGTLDMAIASELTDVVYAEVLTLYKGRTAVYRYDIGSLESGGTTVRDGLKPGEVYRLTLQGMGLTYPTDFDGALIEWVNAPDVQTTSQVAVFSR